MKSYTFSSVSFRLFCLTVFLFCLYNSGFGQSNLKAGGQGFVQNRGQVLTTKGEPADNVLFQMGRPGVEVFILNDLGISFQFERHYSRKISLVAGLADVPVIDSTETFRVNMHLKNANLKAAVVLSDSSSDYINYYRPDLIRTRTFGTVIFKDVYPGIDWKIYSTEKGVKYDFIVHPGANPRDIQMVFSDQEKLYIDEEGSLVQECSLGAFKENKPVSFQDGSSVNTDFILRGNEVSFKIKDYDKSRELVIDPDRIWATYFGGDAADWGVATTADSYANVYFVGHTQSSLGLAPNGLQTSFGGNRDLFLVKYNLNGDLLWSTYYGGEGMEYVVSSNSVKTDSFDNIVIIGMTTSTINIAYQGFQDYMAGGPYGDGLVAKFDQDGIRIWATYYGGGGSDAIWGCDIDNSDNILVTGETDSYENIAYNGSNMSLTPGSTAFIAKITSGGTRLWGTYFGGNGNDLSISCAVDTTGSVYICGTTSSFDLDCSSGFQSSPNGQGDAYLAKFSSSGEFQWATYFGGELDDASGSCEVSSDQKVYLVGHTRSTENIAWNGHQNAIGGERDAFIAQFDVDGNRIWSSYYGGLGSDGGDGPPGCASDDYNNVYLCGNTGSGDNIGYNGFRNNGMGGDGFLVKFSSDGIRQWGTYCGAMSTDQCFGCGCDNQGNVYVAGMTQSPSGITFNGFQNNFGGGECDSYLVKFQGATLISNPLHLGNDTIICPGSYIHLNAGYGYDSYLWSTGENTPSITVAPTASAWFFCQITIDYQTFSDSLFISVNPFLSWYPDLDGDSYGATVNNIQDCFQPIGYVSNSLDCDDSEPFMYFEICGNEIDEDCSGSDLACFNCADLTITASDTAICAGESVNLSVGQINAVTSISNSILPVNLRTGLVGYWPFNGNANDESGNGNNGTVNGATLTTDRFGNSYSAYSFDGVDDWIDISNYFFNNGWEEMSINLWFNSVSNNSTTGPGQTFFNTSPHTGIGVGYSYQGSERIYVFKNSNPAVSSWDIFANTQFNASTIPLNTWHNISIVKSGLTYQFYFDGQLDNTINTTIVATDYFCNLRFGAITCCSPEVFSGKLDDVFIFNRSLSFSEIQQIYSPNQTSYSWSNGATTPAINVAPSETTTYTCTVSANGVSCTDSVTVVVNDFTPLELGNDITVCGTSTTIAAPDDYDSYVWNTGETSNSISVATSGIYSCTVTQGECSATDAVEITLIDATITTSHTEACVGENISLSVAELNSNMPSGNSTLSANLQSGLVSYWPFNGNANDESGNGNNGVVHGATLTLDRFGNSNSAYSFDGINDFISVAHSEVFNLTNEYSISLWCTLTDYSEHHTLMNKNNTSYGSNDPFNIEFLSAGYYEPAQININEVNVVDGALFYQWGNGVISEGIIYNSGISLNEWHNIQIVFSDLVRLFIDGVLVQEYQRVLEPVVNSTDVAIGAWLGTDIFHSGKIDDVSIFNRALTAIETQQLYTLGQTNYLWSTGESTPVIIVSPSETTNYTCTVSTNNISCTGSVTVEINNVELDLGNDVTICGTSTILDAPEGYDSYHWNTGEIINSSTFASSSGTYYCYVSQDGDYSLACGAVDSVYVTLIDATITTNNTTVCLGDNVTLSIGQLNSSLTEVSSVTLTSVQSGLVSYWPFNGNANDESGNGNNGIIYGAELVSDRFGNSNSAYSFNGQSDFIQTNLVGPIGSTSRSISYWMKSESVQPNMTVLSYGNNNFAQNDFQVSHNWSCTGIAVTSNDLGWEYSAGNVDSLWHNYILVFDNIYGNSLGSVKVYKDGVQLGDGCIGYDGILVNTGGDIPICIGKHHTGMQNYFNGILDDIFVYDYAFSPTQVYQFFSSENSMYQWSNGQTTPVINVSPTETTTYTCTVSANGVSCTDSVTIVVNNAALDLGSDVTICGTETTIVAPSGFDSYLWSTGETSNSISVETSGTYTCTVTQGECSSTDTVDVTLIDATIIASDTAICAGETVTLSVPEINGSNILSNSTLPQNLQVGLVGYWPFSGNANDESGNGYNGTAVNTNAVADRFGDLSALHFGDTSDSRVYVEIDSTMGVSEKTISIWFKYPIYPVNDYPHLIMQEPSAGSDIYEYIHVLGSIYGLNSGRLSASGIGSSVSHVNDNQWHHLALVWNYANGIGSMYLDGNLESENANQFNPVPIKSFTIGNTASNWNNGSRYTGDLDDVSIYSRALDSSEIQQLFNLGQPTYLWSTGALSSTINVTPLLTSTYTCTVTENGVSCSESVTIEVNNVRFNLGNDSTICGTETILSAPAGIDSYLWNTGETSSSILVSTSGTYSCTLTEENCSETDAISIVLIDASISASNTEICSGENVTLSVNEVVASNSTLNSILPSNLQDGLVGYWPFNGNANDESGNGYDGIPVNISVVEDRFGNLSAYHFGDAFDSRVEVDINNPVEISEKTISIWFKYPVNLDNDYPHLFMQGLGSATDLIEYAHVLGPIYGVNAGKLGSSTIGSTTSFVNDNQWHHLALVMNYSTGSGFIYLDGNLELENYIQVAPIPIASFVIGNRFSNWHPGWRFTGELDDLAIYNRALSPSEILQLYNQEEATYSWSTGATTPTINVSPTETTTYTCSITANGVSCADSVTIVVNNVSVDLGNDITTCDTSATIAAAAIGDSYLWSTGESSNSISVSTSGTYSCTVTQGECSATDVIEVTLIDATIAASDTVICAGESAILSVGQINMGTSTSNSVLPANLQTGLVGYWPFNGNANDESGNNNNGNINGAILSNDIIGNSNSAFAFNGNSHIYVPFSESINSIQNGLTMSSWIYMDGGAGPATPPRIMELRGGYGGGGDAGFVMLSQGNSNESRTFEVRWYNNDGSTNISISPTVSVSALGWHHIVFSCDGQTGEGKLYIDGVFADSNALQSNQGLIANCNYNGNGLFIGAESSMLGYWGGSIDEVLLYNRAISDSEVQQLYSQSYLNYSWSTGATTPTIDVSPTETTTYVCTVTANGVSCTDSVTVFVNDVAVNLGNDMTTCDSSTTITATANGDSYLWSTGETSNSISVSTSGNYSCTVTQGECTATDTIDVTLIDATIAASDAAICAGESVTLSVGQISTGASTSNSILPANLQTGLVGYWPFNGNANDESGNGNALNQYFVSYGYDRFGNSNASFLSNGIELGNGSSMTSNNPVFNIGQEEYTIGLWMNVANTSQVTRCLFNTIPHTGIAIGYNDNNAPGYVVYDIGPANAFWTNLYMHGSTTNYTSEDWHYVVVKKEGVNYSQYIDGQLDHSYINPTAADYNYDVNFRISGISPEYQIFEGNIDDVHIYNRALSQDEILQHFNLTGNNSSPLTYQWSNGETTSTINVSPTETTTYTCTITANGVSCTDSVTIVVNDFAIDLDLGSDVTICGTETTISAPLGFDSYLWNTGETSNSILVSTSGTYSCTVPQGECSTTDSINVTLIDATITASDSLVCRQAPVTLSVAVGNIDYLMVESANWGPGYYVFQGVSSGVLTPFETTVYTREYFYNGGSCISSVTVEVSDPILELGDIVTYCEGGTELIAVGDYETYLWSTGETSSSIFIESNGIYSCTATNQYGCSATDNVEVVFIDPEIAQSDSLICAGETVNLSVENLNLNQDGNCLFISENLNINLAGLWPFCGNANCEIGSGNNGLVYGATLTADRFGNENSAYQFNGGVIEIPHYETLGVTQYGQQTVSVWALVEGNQSVQHLMGKRSNGSQLFNWELSVNEEENQGLIYSGGIFENVYGAVRSEPLPRNQWMQITGTYSEGTWKLYLNGELQAETTSSTFYNDVFCTLTFGSSGSYEPFYGKLDDIAIFNRALTEEEVEQLYSENSLTYAWSNGMISPSIEVSPDSTTTYFCSVTSNGVTCTDSVTIVVENTSLDLGEDITTCDSSTTITAADNGDSYLWSTGENTTSISVSTSGTYSCTVTQGECSATDVIDVTLINATINVSDTIVCSGESVMLSVDEVINGVYLWSTGETTSTINVSPTETTTYTCEVTVNGVTCTDEVTVYVGNPTASITPNGVVEICSGDSITLNGSGGGAYSWNTGESSQNITVNTEAVYTLTVTDEFGCTDSESQLVKVNALPTATITAASSTTLCEGQSVMLNANTNTGVTYQWFNNNTAIAGATSSFYVASTSGSYTVQVTNANGCSTTSAAKVVTVNPLPTASINTSSPTTICQGNNVVLTANTGDGYAYQWQQNGAAISGATANAYAATTSGVYAVTVTNVFGCSATSASTTVIVQATPLAVITPSSTSICEGASATLTANTGSGLSYQWYKNGSIINGAAASIYSGTTAGSYTVVVTNTNGCQTTSAASVITVNALPIATLTAGSSTSLCQGTSVVLSASTGSGYAYQWLLNGSAIANATSSSYAASSAGSYTVTVTNASGCSATSSSIAVTVSSLPTATITPNGSTNLCQGSSVMLNANTGTGYAYQWQLNGTNIVGANSTGLAGFASGYYTVVVTNIAGCSVTSDAVTITISAPPVANITSSTTNLCQGASAVLTANTGTGLTYQWYKNTVAINGATGSTYSAISSGSYTVAVTNSNGCSTSSNAIIINVNTPPTSTITASSSTTICPGGSVVLNATSGSGNGYQWLLNGVEIANAVFSNYTATVDGSYTVVVTNTSGCSATSSATTVTVGAALTASISTTTATTFCQGGSVVLSATTGTGYTYQWFNGANAISGATASTYAATATGAYKVVITNASGCTGTSAATTVTVTTAPTATISSPSTSICSGGSVVLTANTGTGFTYVWKRNGTTISGATASTYTATLTGSYTVVVSNGTACSATSSAITLTSGTAPTATITSTATSFCQGNTLLLTANTGTGLTYQWRLNGTAITGATASAYTAAVGGSYTVVVTNASGCSATSAAKTLVMNALPTAVINSTTNAICAGASVVMTATTGTGYSYQWKLNGTNISGATSSSYTATAAGSYTLVVSIGSGCSATSAAKVITVSALPTATIGSTANSFCTGGSLVLTANSGTGFTYQWKKNGTNISGATAVTYTATTAGSYTVVVTNASGCSKTSSAKTLTVTALPTATISCATTTVCQGGSITLSANTGSGLTYVWKRNAITITGATASTYAANQTGAYTVTVTNSSGCSATSAAKNITVNALPTASITSLITVIPQGGSVVLTASAASGQTYQWKRNGSNISGATASTYSATQVGTYTVFVGNASGCSATSNAIVLTLAPNPIVFDNDIAVVAVTEEEPTEMQSDEVNVNDSFVELNTLVNLYPNPTRSDLNVQVGESLVGSDMYIFDALGKQIHKQQILSTNTQLSVNNFSNGNYIVRIGEVVKRFEVIK